jgi:hypothetical protein
MNTNAAVNQVFDKHPFSTGTLFISVIVGLFLVFGVMLVILKMTNRKKF